QNDFNFKASYASNGVVMWGWNPLKQTKLNRPAETVMLLESTWGCNDLGDWVGRKNTPPACGWGKGFYQHRGDIGTHNWAFFDGHAKTLKLRAVFRTSGNGDPMQIGNYNLMGREADGYDCGVANENCSGSMALK